MCDQVLKWHHPCFFDYCDFFRIDGGFQPGGGSFCPFRSDDTFFAPRDAFFALPPSGIPRSSMLAPASSADKRKKSNHTTGMKLRAATRRACLRSCKRRKHVIGRECVWELPDSCGSSIKSPKFAPSGFFLGNAITPSTEQGFFLRNKKEIKGIR